MRCFTKLRINRYLLLFAALVPAVVFCGFLLFSCDAEAGNGVFYVDSVYDRDLGEIQDLFVTPVRREYPLKGYFNWKTDFTVLALYPSGAAGKIEPDSTTVYISEGDEDKPLTEDTYQFTSAGEKIVTVEYGGKSFRYAVWVLGGDGGGIGGPSTDGPGLIVEIN